MLTDLEMTMGGAGKRPSFPGGELDLRLCDRHMASILHRFKQLRLCETGLFLSPLQVEPSRTPGRFWLVHKCMTLTRDAQQLEAAFTDTGTWETAEGAWTLLEKIFFRCSYWLKCGHLLTWDVRWRCKHRYLHCCLLLFLKYSLS